MRMDLLSASSGAADKAEGNNCMTKLMKGCTPGMRYFSPRSSSKVKTSCNGWSTEETSTSVASKFKNAAYSSGEVVSGFVISRVTRLTSLKVEERVITGTLKKVRWF